MLTVWESRESWKLITNVCGQRSSTDPPTLLRSSARWQSKPQSLFLSVCLSDSTLFLANSQSLSISVINKLSPESSAPLHILMHQKLPRNTECAVSVVITFQKAEWGKARRACAQRTTSFLQTRILTWTASSSFSVFHLNHLWRMALSGARKSSQSAECEAVRSLHDCRVARRL